MRRRVPLLAQKSAAYVVFDVLAAGVPFLLLPVMTRYLTPEEYGIVAMFSIIMQVLAVLTGLNMHGAVTVNFFRMAGDEFKVFVGNVFIIQVASFGIVLALTAAIVPELKAVSGVSGEWLVLGVVAASAQFVTLINLCLWQAEENPQAFGTYQFAQTLANVGLALALVVGAGLGVDGRLGGIVAVAFLFGGLSLWIVFRRRYVTMRFDRTMAAKALRFGLPLVPHALAKIVKSGADRFLLTAVVGLHAAGPYSVAYQVASAIGILAFSVNKAFSPFLFRKLNEIDERGKEKIVRYTYAYFVGINLLAVILGVLSDMGLDVILGPAFREASPLVLWIAFGFGLEGMYLMVVNYIFYQSRTDLLAVVTVSGAVLHLLVSYWFISERGMLGAAQAQVVSGLVLFFAVWALSNRVYPMPWFFRSAKK